MDPGDYESGGRGFESSPARHNPLSMTRRSAGRVRGLPRAGRAVPPPRTRARPDPVTGRSVAGRSEDEKRGDQGRERRADQHHQKRPDAPGRRRRQVGPAALLRHRGGVEAVRRPRHRCRAAPPPDRHREPCLRSGRNRCRRAAGMAWCGAWGSWLLRVANQRSAKDVCSAGAPGIRRFGTLRSRPGRFPPDRRPPRRRPPGGSTARATASGVAEPFHVIKTQKDSFMVFRL